MSGTDLPKISDEDAVELLARQAWRRRHSITWESGADIERQEFLTVARLDLAALVASGYRREADLRHDEEVLLAAWDAAAELLGEAAKGARQRSISANYAEGLADAASTLAETVAELRAQRPATALEQAQPLLAAPKTNAVDLIAAERQRQITAEGWTPEHDAQHSGDQIAVAAACYALPPSERKCHPRLAGGHGDDRGDRYVPVPILWPWRADDWKPKPDDRVRELVKAGALIAAEIDRLTTPVAAISEVESLEPVESPEGQERSEEKEHG